MTPRILPLLLAATALTAAATPSTAGAAGFTPPIEIGPLDSPSNLLETGMTADGETVVVSRAGAAGPTGAVRATIRTTDGRLREQTLGQGTLGDDAAPSLDVAGNGRAVVAWGSSGRILYALREPGAGFGPVQTAQISGPVTRPEAGIDAAGNVTFVWRAVEQGGFGARAIVRRASDGVFVNQHDIGASLTDIFAVRVAVNDAGRAAATVTTAFGGIALSVAHRTTPLGKFAASASLGTIDAGGEVAVDEQGNAVVAWTGSGTVPRMQITPPDGTQGKVVALDAKPGGGVSVGLSKDGRGTATWARGEGGQVTIVTCAVDPSGCVTPVTPLRAFASSAQVAATTTRTASTPDGAVVVAWSEATGAKTNTIGAAGRKAGEPFGPADLHPAGHGGAEVAIASSGDGVVAWHDESSGTERVRIAGFDASPPRIDTAAFPASGGAGEVLPFSASASDLWGPVRFDWSFGDGQSASGSSVTHAFTGGGARSVRLTATDAAGNVASATGETSVVAPPVPPPPGGGPPADRTAPRFTKKPKAKRVRFTAKRGTTFTYGLSEPATVAIKVQRRVRKGRRIRLATVTTITRASKAGTTKLAFKRSLKPGSYRATFTPRDKAGNRGKAVTLALTVAAR